MTDRDALTLTVYGEARGEPIDGKIAVAMVIRNRVATNYRGKATYAEVCFDPQQFSCWNPDDVNAAHLKAIAPALSQGIYHDEALRLCQEIADATIGGRLADNTQGANHYLTTALYTSAPPTWARQVPVITRGAQVFLRVA